MNIQGYIDQINAELPRIQSAKDDLITRLESKGVTVPSGAKIDELPPLVDNIAGNSSSIQVEKIVGITSDANGSISPSVISHDAGFDGMESVLLYFEDTIDAAKIKKGEKVLGVTGTYEASGGASVETCTVEVTSFKGIEAYAYTAYENGEIISKGSLYCNDTSLTLTNVICGSAIYVNNYYSLNGTRCSGGITETYGMGSLGGIFGAPTSAGAIGTIEIYDDD